MPICQSLISFATGKANMNMIRVFQRSRYQYQKSPDIAENAGIRISKYWLYGLSEKHFLLYSSSQHPATYYPRSIDFSFSALKANTRSCPLLQLSNCCFRAAKKNWCATCQFFGGILLPIIRELHRMQGCTWWRAQVPPVLTQAALWSVWRCVTWKSMMTSLTKGVGRMLRLSSKHRNRYSEKNSQQQQKCKRDKKIR